MIISEMNVKLTASTSGFARAMDKAGGRVKKFKAGAAKVGKALGTMATGVGLAAAGIAAVAWPTKLLFDLGASIAETGSKFDTVFGPEAAGEVSAFLDTFANKAGLTTNEAKGLVATTGAIAQGLGFTQKASGDMAVEITKLAGDLSSFNNLPTEQVLSGINSALTGEREQMKALGIVVQEADVQQQAFANTGKTVAKNLTAQEKATATLQLITERAGSAVGDLNRTQGSAANVAKRLKTRFLEIRDAIATALMPAFREILVQIGNNEQKFIDLKNKILENSGVISAWAMVFIEALKFVAAMIWFTIRRIKNMGEIIINVAKILGKFATGDFAGARDEVDNLKGNFEDMRDATQDFVDQAMDLGAALILAFNGGKDVATEFQQVVIDTEGPINDLEDSVATMAVGVADKMEDIGHSISKNIVGRITDAAEGSKDAFAGFFAYMKKQLIDLAVKALLFKAILFAGEKFGFDMAKVGNFATSMTGFSSATGGGDTGDAGAGTPILSGRAANASPRGMIVNQNIHFEVSAIDGRDAARFIKEQGGAIAEVIATAAKDSTGFRRQLQGA